MQVYLDGEPVEVQGSTLSDALRAAGERLDGRFVVSVEADGARVPAEDLDNPPQYTPYASEMRFTSADPETMLRDLIDDSLDVIDLVRKKQQEIGEGVQRGDIAGALQSLNSVLEQWDLLKSSAAILEQLRPRLAPEGDPAIAGLATALTDLRDAVKGTDWSQLGDVMLYDLDEQAQAWHGLFERAASEVA